MGGCEYFDYPVNLAHHRYAIVQVNEFMPESILIVENDVLIQEALTDLLDFAGINSLQAENGRDAIATFQTHHKDIGLVIMDMGLDDMRGSEILPELEAIRPDIPVIVASGEDEQKLVRLFQAHPNVFVLPKPYDIDFVLKQAKQMLGI